MDKSLFYLINDAAGHFLLLDAFGVFCASVAIFVIFAAAALLAWRLAGIKGIRLLATTAVSSVAAWVLCSLLKDVVASLRPFMELGQSAALLVAPSQSYAFPSGHSAAAFAVAVSVLLYSRQMGYVFLAMATVIAWGRVFVGVHWPLDVIGGALLGSVTAVGTYSAIYFVLKKIERKRRKYAPHRV